MSSLPVDPPALRPVDQSALRPVERPEPRPQPVPEPGPVPAVAFRVTAAGTAELTRRQARSNRFVAPSRGVRLSAECQQAPQARLEAAVVGAVPGAVLTDVDAARVWGLPLPPWFQDLGPVSLAVDPDRAQPRRRDVRGRRLRLPAEHLTEHEGRRITTPGRTWLDCAAVVPVGYVVAMGDAGLRRGLMTQAELKGLTTWGFRRRGVAVARSALPILDPRSESPGESVVRTHLVLAGVPAPECNANIVGSDGWIARVDLCWRRQRLIVEYDGAVHLLEQQRRSDARRRNLLQDAGWTVITVTADDLRRPWLLVDLVQRTLARLARR